jgi:uncharacterized SAM-binding protein YcdF (DUF218 family)
VIVIMGAAVAKDGTPSDAVLRRTRLALQVGARLEVPIYLPTGGAPYGGPPEAHVIRRLLREAGVRPSRIIVEDRAEDTLQSVVHCAEIIRPLGPGAVFVCTDRYHLARCRSLFRLAGIATQPPLVRETTSVAMPRWLRSCVHEAVALPFDALLLLAGRIRGRLSPAR